MPFKQTTLAWKTFIFTTISFLIILTASLFLFNTYWRLQRQRLSPVQLSRRIESIVQRAQSEPLMNLRHIKRGQRLPGGFIKLTPAPRPNARQIKASDTKQLQQLIRQHPRGLNLTIDLGNGQWLTISTRKGLSAWQRIGFLAALLIILLAIIAVATLLSRQIATPVQRLAQAATDFATNLTAAPLAVEGPAEIKKATTAFNQLQNRIQQLLENRTLMLAAISHDLKTPITRLKLRTESIEAENLQTKIRDDLNVMDQMLSSILAFSRDFIQTESIDHVDLGALLESIVHDQQDAGFDVAIELPEAPQIISGRLYALKRAFTNLIDNAVKYGERAEVIVTSQQDTCLIKIRDFGPGIPENQQDKVILPFYRGDAARSPEISGSGLGLTAAHDIMMAHGGQLKLSNHKEGGLIVSVTLPCKK
jgi:signal transduction histidine kinase